MKNTYSDQVKAAAKGRGREIISALTDIPDQVCDGKNHPCPVCGGKDRFNACRKKYDETGQVFCNKCDLTGDLFNVLMKMNGWTFPEAIERVGEYLGLPKRNGRTTHKAAATGKHSLAKTASAKKKKSKPIREFDSQQDLLRAYKQSVERKLPDDVGLLGDPIVYDYVDTNGDLQGAVVRYDLSDGGKQIRQLSMRNGKWRPCAMPSGRPLYRANEIADAEVVHVVEGEECGDLLRKLGFTATTSCGGSGAADKTEWTSLDGKTVYLIPDNDGPGKKYLQKVLMLIEEQAITAKVKVIDLAECVEGLQEGEDIADVLERFGPGEEEAATEFVRNLTDRAQQPDARSFETKTLQLDGFNELIPLEPEELPQLALDFLPDSFAEPVRKISNSTETPPDLAAVAVLATSSYANSHKYEIEVELGYSEPANLYIAAVMDIGGRKSPVFRLGTKPVTDYERSLQVPLDAVTCETGGDPEFLDVDFLSSNPPAEVLEVAERPTSFAPNVEQCIADDFTPEALAAALGRNGHRMFLASSEPDMFDNFMGRYSGKPNLSLLLKAHDGDSYRENRKLAKKPLFIDRPLLSTLVMAQPEAIAKASKTELLRGRGVLDRFFFVVPKSNLGERALLEPRAEDLDLSDYEERLTTLLQNPIQVDSMGEPCPTIVRPTPEAHAAWKQFQRSIESRMAEGEQLAAIAGWASKLPGRIARVALNFALLESGPGVRVVDRSIMESAIAFGEFLIPHAYAVLNGVSCDKKTAAFREFIQEIYRNEPDEISRRDVMRFDRNLTVKDANYVLELLVEHGYLKLADRTNRPGRPSKRYIVRPGLF